MGTEKKSQKEGNKHRCQRKIQTPSNIFSDNYWQTIIHYSFIYSQKKAGLAVLIQVFHTEYILGQNLLPGINKW